MQNKQICLFLLGPKGLSVLQQAVRSASNSTILRVIISRDTKTQDLSHIDIEKICAAQGIQFTYSKKLSRETTEGMIKNSFVSSAAGWRQLLPSYENKLIICHDSLLPKYRGFNPLVTALIQGDTQIGVSAIWAAEEYDSGEIIFQEATEITYPITILEAIKHIEFLYSNLAEKIFKAINCEKPIASYAQNHSNATYSLWRNQDDYYIDWNDKASALKRKIDASGYPYEGACTIYDNSKIIINKAEEFEDKHIINRTPGKVLYVQNTFPVIVCGEGLLAIKKAIYEDGTNVLPFKRFRTKLSSQI